VIESRRQWAAMMVALDLDTCESILRGLRVKAGNLDAETLRRALHGGRLPDSSEYIEITPAMFAAIDEAGPLLDSFPTSKKKGARR
jgi:hypothetical protein